MGEGSIATRSGRRCSSLYQVVFQRFEFMTSQCTALLELEQPVKISDALLEGTVRRPAPGSLQNLVGSVSVARPASRKQPQDRVHAR